MEEFGVTGAKKSVQVRSSVSFETFLIDKCSWMFEDSCILIQSALENSYNTAQDVRTSEMIN